MKYKKFIIFPIVIAFIFILNGCNGKTTIENIPELNVGDTYQIKYSHVTNNGKNNEISFETSNKDIATIDNQGVIKALAPGEVEISILTESGKKPVAKASISIVQPVDSINCENELTVAIGNSQNIEAQAMPKNSTDPTLLYKSSDENIIKVDYRGVLTGIKKGTAIVKITSVNNITKECKIIVKQPVKSINLDKVELNLNVGDTETIKATLAPQGADYNIETTFSSSNVSVAKVSSNGNITAVSPGSATIISTVKDVNGNLLTAKCEVQVATKKTSGNNPNQTPVSNQIPVSKNTHDVIQGSASGEDNDIIIKFQPQETVTKIIIQHLNIKVDSINNADCFSWSADRLTVTVDLSSYTRVGTVGLISCSLVCSVIVEGENLVYDGVYWKKIG
jgi:uncharacterized protein YjdB